MIKKNREIIKIYPNKFGHIALRQDDYPQNIINLVIEKEDRFFWLHPGINPISTLRAIALFIMGNKNPSSSTITQQTVKILLANEQNRNIKNKIKESFYALALEAHTSKKEILNIYLNSIFLGNKAEGLASASKLYFELSPDELQNHQIIQLLAIITSPSENHPYTTRNIEASQNLAKNFGIEIDKNNLQIIDKKKSEKQFANFTTNESFFEINSLGLTFDNQVERVLNIDNEISKKSREIVQDHLKKLFTANARNAAIVIIATDQNKKENKLISIIGSPDSNQNLT